MRLKDTIVNAFTSIGSGIKGVINFMIDGVNTLISGFTNIASFKTPSWLGGKTIGIQIPKIPKFALGTPYFKGGLAQTDERGGEIKQYPNGTKIIPADKSEKILNDVNGRKIEVHIHVAGSVVGIDNIVDAVGEGVNEAVKSARSNI
jgi:hypothetical protein